MKRRALVTASVLLCAGMALMGLPGCDDNDKIAGTGTIGGNVVSFHTAVPAASRLAAVVEGVVVTITGPVTRTATTDALGNFIFTDLPPGNYTMSFTYNGVEITYSLNGAPVVLVVGDGQTIRMIGIEIEDGGVVIGNVLTCNPGEDCEVPEAPGKLPAPKQVSPANDALLSDHSGNVELDWRAVDGAASYVVEVQREEIGFATRVIFDPVYSRYAKHGTKDTHCTLQFDDGVYRWQVWAVDENGNPGQKSSWWHFMMGLTD